MQLEWSSKFFTQHSSRMANIVAVREPLKICKPIVESIAILVIYMLVLLILGKGKYNQSVNKKNSNSTKINHEVLLSDCLPWSQDPFLQSLNTAVVFTHTGEGFNPSHVAHFIFPLIPTNRSPLFSCEFVISQNNGCSHGLPPRAVRVRATVGRQSCRGSLFIQNLSQSSRTA